MKKPVAKLICHKNLMRGMRFFKRQIWQFFLTVILGFIWSGTNGQDLCTQNLEDARDQFNRGSFYNVEPLLSSCIKSGFTKQERIDALELLALTKLYLDDLEAADSIYLRMLNIDPEHEVNPLIDPVDLVFLHESFRTEALFTWHILAGINITNVSILQDYSLYSTDDRNEKYGYKTGYEFGAGFDWTLNKKLKIGIEGIFSRKRFTYADEFLDNNYTVSLTERGDWIHLPVYIKYDFGQGRWSYYVYGGGSFDYLIQSNHIDIIKNFNPDPVGPANFDLNPFRNKITYSAVAGFGVKFKTNGIDYLIIDLKTNFGLKNLVKETSRYESQQRNLLYGYVDDAFRMNIASLSFRFLRPYYKPRKITGTD